MRSSKKRKVTAAFFAAAALSGVAHAAPILNMNDLVGSNTTTESTTQATTDVADPVVRPMAIQPTTPTTQLAVAAPQQVSVNPIQAQPAVQQRAPMQSVPTVTPMVPRVRPVPVPDTAKALEEQYRAVSQPQYVVNKQNNTVMEPTLAMHSLINVQRKTEPITVQKQVDGKQQIQTTQVQRTPIVIQEQSTTPMVVANTTTTKSVIAKRSLTIRDIQRAERERLAKLAEEQAAQQEAMQQQSSEQAQAVRQMAAERAAEAQRQAALLAQQQEAQRQAELLAQQQEAQRQAAIKAEQERIAAQQAEAQRQAAIKAEQERIAAEQAEADAEKARLEAAEAKAAAEAAAKAQAEAQRQAAIKAEQERIAAEQAKAEQEAKAKAQAEAEAQRQAAIKAEQERIAAEQAKAEQEAKAKAEQEAKAKAEAEAKARAEAEAKQAQEPKLPESYVNERNQASTKGSTTTGEKNILSQPIDPPLQADTSAKITLTFDINNYESMTGTVDNKEIKYRAFEYIPYVSNPIDIDQQYINIYIPEEYFNDGTVNGYNTQTAPIFMPNNVGGYMPSQPMTPKVENNKPNSALYALSRGYVVASPATRGRTNKASDGNFIGKAPAVIVDLQAATAYLHANDATMPGNAKRIITNGTSAGGAVSLLQGATGNTSDYQPYLQALGAATASTDVYASSAYAPMTNLDAADMAYEWSYNGITSFNKVTMGQGELPQANVGGAPAPIQRSVQRVNLTNDDVAYSDLLKSHFPDYVNNLQLRDRTGVILKLDKKGNGTFKQYVKSFIIDAANKAKSNGTDVSRYSFLVLDKNTGMVKDIDWDAYNSFTSRSKEPGAFDSRANDSGENSLFGTSTSDTNHFTITAALHDTTSNNDVYVENAKIVTMMNPMNYLGSPSATNAKYYRIRYGTADSNTSVAIPLIVGTRAQNLGYSVDMATPFGVDHAGDYDLQDLFNWMDSIVKNGR